MLDYLASFWQLLKPAAGEFFRPTCSGNIPCGAEQRSAWGLLNARQPEFDNSILPETLCVLQHQSGCTQGPLCLVSDSVHAQV